MLKHLSIQNIILIGKAELSFSAGFNVLTGETGSGKSAIMHSLNLAMGERADLSLIRCGCDKAIVEATFDIDHLNIHALLSEGGIYHEPGQELIIRREISTSGKGRIFINNQMAQLFFLKKIGSQLIQMVGQHANQRLFTRDFHRKALDLFGDLQTDLHNFQHSYDIEKKLKNLFAQMLIDETHRIREIEICKEEIEELEKAQIKLNEEEELFTEYTRLSHSEELLTKIGEINQALTGDRQPLLPLLNRQKQSLESIVKIDLSLQNYLSSFQNALLELQEISYSLKQYQSHLHSNPKRLHEINERLTLLNRLKRKYGENVYDILAYLKSIREKLKVLDNADQEKEKKQHEIHEWEIRTNHYANELSLKRQKSAICFEKELEKQLQTLNMAKAKFTVQMTKGKRTNDGDDCVEFFICPNVGERQISLKEGASGGELSRIVLALQTLLAGKEKISTIIFDEVDANIGGETARIVGNNLRLIGQQHQVIAITHFPQVASQANHHIQISKEEKDGRTLTHVKEILGMSKEKELARMSGYS